MRNPFYMRRNRRRNHPLMRVIGGALLAAVGASVVALIPEIKRYIKISRM
jgi:L-asparaginase II